MWGLQKFSGYQILGLVFALYLAAKLLARYSGVPQLTWFLPGLVFVLHYCSEAGAQWRSLRPPVTFSKQLRCLIPPALLAWLKFNGAALVSYRDMLWQRTVNADKKEPATQKFSYHQRSQYGTVFVIILIGLLVEIPFSLLMVNLLPLSVAARQQAHLVLLGLTLYLLFLLLADRYQLRRSAHSLSASHLHLQIAQRFAADLAIDAIVAVEVFKHDKRLWCAQGKISLFDCHTVTPVDAPNVLVELRTGEQQMQSFQLKQPAPRYIFIYVDQAAEFVQALQAACHHAALKESGEPLLEPA